MKDKSVVKLISQLEKYSLAIFSAKGFRDILYQTCKAAVEILEVEHSGFAIFEKEKSSFRVIAEYPHNGNIKTINSFWEIRNSHAEKELLRNKIINVYDLQIDNEFGDLIKGMLLGFEIQSVLIIPICVNNEVVASFSLDSVHRKRKFTPEDISLCKILAGYTSISMRINTLSLFRSSDIPVIENSIRLNLDINRNYGLCIINKDFKVIWTNKFYKIRFGEQIEGKVCFQHIKNFKKPCSWCPHLQVIKDKGVSLAISPTPSKIDPTSFMNSQLLSFPLKFDNNGNIELILEILLELNDNILLDERRRQIYNNHQNLASLLRKVEHQLIPYLMGYYLVFEDDLDFDEAYIYLVEDLKNNEPIFYKKIIYRKDKINDKLNYDFKNLLDDSSHKYFDQIIGEVHSKAEFESDLISIKNEIKKYSTLIRKSEPRRISINEIGVTFELTNQSNIILIVRVIKEDTYLTDSQFNAFTFFVPFIREVIHTKIEISNLKTSIENLKNMINVINTNKNILIHSAPFVIGKVHDISNIYSKIMGEVITLKGTSWDSLESAKRNELLCNSADTIHKYASNLNLILGTMTNIVTLCTPKIEQFDIANVVIELKMLFREKLYVKSNKKTVEKESIEFIIDKCCDTVIQSDPVLFSQVFQNLIQNSITAFNSVYRRGKVIMINFLKDDNTLIIEYSDNACGISPDVIDFIWEAYYSTKLKGTGLGLFFVKKIIEMFNGKIEVKTKWGYGTTFIIKIPLSTN